MPNYKTSAGTLPLHRCIDEDNYDHLIGYINFNHDINKRDIWGQTPIFRIFEGDFKQYWCEMLTELLKNKADILALDHRGRTPLMLIVKEKRFPAYRIIQRLPPSASKYLNEYRLLFSYDQKIVQQIDYLNQIANESLRLVVGLWFDQICQNVRAICGPIFGEGDQSLIHQKPSIECPIPGCIDWFSTEFELTFHLLLAHQN